MAQIASIVGPEEARKNRYIVLETSLTPLHRIKTNSCTVSGREDFQLQHDPSIFGSLTLQKQAQGSAE
jgi:hypothetical protein